MNRYPQFDRWLSALLDAGIQLDPLEIADTFWLARMLAGATGGERGASVETPPHADPAPRSEPRVEPEVLRDEGGVAPRERPAPVLAREYQVLPHAASGSAFHSIRIPDAPALYHKLELKRALRPLRRRIASYRNQELDEVATAHHMAVLRYSWPSAPLMPVLRPGPARWLQLVMVVDRSQTMAIWRRSLDELHALLHQLGAFEHIRVVYVKAAPGEPEQLVAATGANAEAWTVVRGTDLGTRGRSLLVVVSDCLSSHWTSGAMSRFLEQRAKQGPLAVVQVLSPHLWRRTSLAGLVPASVYAATPGAPPHRLRVESEDDTIPHDEADLRFIVPVVPLLADGLAAWARMVAGHPTGVAAGFWFDPRVPDWSVEPSNATLEEPEIEVLVDRFLRVSSATARKLAAYLAAVPLTMPVLRYIRMLFVPEAGEDHLVEVLFSGLLVQRMPDLWTIVDEAEAYEFRPGARELLLLGLGSTTIEHVARRIGAELDALHGADYDFAAFLVSSEDASTSLGRPFAKVTRALAAVLRPVVSTPPIGRAEVPENKDSEMERPDREIGDPPARISLPELDAVIEEARGAGWRELAILGPEGELQWPDQPLGVHTFHLREPIGKRIFTLASLTELTSLDLSGNRIGDAGTRALVALAGLTSLRLGNNQIGDDGARTLSKLSNLSSLDLSINQIRDGGARALASLSNLSTLDLTGNQIGANGARSLLDAWCRSPRSETLRYLSLRSNGNMESMLPPELFASTDAQTILAAYRRYREAEQQNTLRPLNEAKLMVVGNEAVGKTSLIRYLVHDKPRSPDERKTPGTAIHEKIELSTWSPQQSQVRLNVWDFGGREIMRGTHRFFLTARSLYLLVLEDRREDDRSIYEWLEFIAQCGGDSPVIVVINKSDHDLPQLQLDESALRRTYPAIAGFARTSCNAGAAAAQSIAGLRAQIAATLSESERLKHVRDPIPLSWLRIKDAIAEQSRERSVLPVRDFERLCERNPAGAEPILDPGEQRALLGLLHDLGVVVAYGLRQDAPAARREITVCDPNWLTGAIYALINSPKVRDQGGELHHEQLAELLDPKQYPPRWHELILSMMQEPALGLCLPIAHTIPTRYLLPDALPVKEPDYGVWPDDALRFRYQYTLLPTGCIPRFIVQAHRYLTATPIWWRTGVVLGTEGCRILVRRDTARHRVEILVAGKTAQRAALSIVRNNFDAVHRYYGRLEVEERVPLPDQPDVDVSYQHLVTLEREKGLEYMYRPENALRAYSVRELLEGVRNDGARRAPSPMKHTILFLAANPVGIDRLDLDREAREILVELKRSGFRDRFELVTRWAAEPLDLLRVLRELEPTIVHFSGHGGPDAVDEHRAGSAPRRDVAGGLGHSGASPRHGLYFQGPDGQPQLVSTEALEQTFGAVGASVKLVVLNACYSDVQAQALLPHVGCVVGMNGSIRDDAARSFAIGFYGGLGERESVDAAYKQGCAAVSLQGIRDQAPPQLAVRAGVDASKLILAADSLEPLVTRAATAPASEQNRPDLGLGLMVTNPSSPVPGSLASANQVPQGGRVPPLGHEDDGGLRTRVLKAALKYLLEVPGSGRLSVPGRELRFELGDLPSTTRNVVIASLVPDLLSRSGHKSDLYYLTLEGLLKAGDERPVKALGAMLAIVADRYTQPGGRQQHALRWSHVQTRAGLSTDDFDIAWLTFLTAQLGETGARTDGSPNSPRATGYDYEFWLNERDLELMYEHASTIGWAAVIQARESSGPDGNKLDVPADLAEPITNVSGTSSTHAVFVIHANVAPDTAFVHTELVPALWLDPDQIRYSSELPIGEILVDTMESFVASSRVTILVLSPALRNAWVDLRGDLASYVAATGGTLVPLLLADCPLPQRLNLLPQLDCRDPQKRPDAFRRLRKLVAPAVSASENARTPLTTQAALTDRDRPRPTSPVPAPRARPATIPTPSTKIDIGILTIRDDEFRAVLDVFPNKAGIVRGKSREYALRHADAGNGQQYTIAVLRQIEQGHGEAQDAARDLLDDLAPKLILVVGIAGALPSDDVKLGDVILSTRIQDFTVEARKTGQDPTYATSGGPIAKELAAAIANLPAREDELGDWTTGLPSPPEVKWSRKGQLYGPPEWQRELRAKLEHHHGKDSTPRAPLYVAGPIASSDRLVKDPSVVIPWLITARNLLAVEMESGGVFRAARERCPMLAIRGISDIIGLRRTDAWTKYACASAAAFTRAFLQTYPVAVAVPSPTTAKPARPAIFSGEQTKRLPTDLQNILAQLFARHGAQRHEIRRAHDVASTLRSNPRSDVDQGEMRLVFRRVSTSLEMIPQASRRELSKLTPAVHSAVADGYAFTEAHSLFSGPSLDPNRDRSAYENIQRVLAAALEWIALGEDIQVAAKLDL